MLVFKNVGPSETLLFFKGIQNCFLDKKQLNPWHHRSFIRDASFSAVLSRTPPWCPSLGAISSVDLEKELPKGLTGCSYRGKLRTKQKRGCKKVLARANELCGLGLETRPVSLTTGVRIPPGRYSLFTLVQTPDGRPPPRHGANHDTPFGCVSHLQAEDQLAFCFCWVYFSCKAATPDNGHILSPVIAPSPTGSCIPEKRDFFFFSIFIYPFI